MTNAPGNLLSENELEITADEKNLAAVQAFVEERLEAAGCSMKAQLQISLAVEEIFINIASYAYAPEQGSASIRVEISEEPAEAAVIFTDSGIPYNPLSRTDPDVTLPADQRQIGGLGIFLTRKTMDDVSYEYRDGRNILTMKKKL